MAQSTASEHQLNSEADLRQHKDFLAVIDVFLEENKIEMNCRLDINHDHHDGNVCQFDHIEYCGGYD